MIVAPPVADPADALIVTCPVLRSFTVLSGIWPASAGTTLSVYADGARVAPFCVTTTATVVPRSSLPFTESTSGGIAAPVAVKVTVAPVTPFSDAVSVFVPALEPSVQLPTVAIPLTSDVVAAPVMLPPPLATTNVTPAPDTAFPFASVTFTEGTTATPKPIVAVWLFPAFYNDERSRSSDSSGRERNRSE